MVEELHTSPKTFQTDTLLKPGTTVRTQFGSNFFLCFTIFFVLHLGGGIVHGVTRSFFLKPSFWVRYAAPQAL